MKIWDYLDYRSFLKDYYQSKKDKSAHFSFRLFSNQAGFKSKSFLQDVISGKRNLSRDSMIKLASYLKMSPKEMSYFQDLVEYNQTDHPDLKRQFLSRLMETNVSSRTTQVLRWQYEFYAHWYHNTIREILSCIEFKGDFKFLAKSLTPQISESEARRSVELMVQLGLIEKSSDGVYKVLAAQITTGDEVASAFVTLFHRENLQVATSSIERVDNEERDISCLVLHLSKEDFQRVKQEIVAFRKKLLSMETDAHKAEKVYHLNFQAFPTATFKGGDK